MMPTNMDFCKPVPAGWGKDDPKAMANREWLNQALQTDDPTKILHGCAIATGNPAMAELVGVCGYDYCWIDAQHNSGMSDNDLMNVIRATECGGAKAFIRVQEPTSHWQIGHVLDMGATGVIVPDVRTVEEVKAAVAAAKFRTVGPGSTDGMRSKYPYHRGYRGDTFQQYCWRANWEGIVMVQLETAEGLENIEEIAKVEGLDGIILGGGDLRLDMGLVAKYNGYDNARVCPEFRAAEQKFIKACKDAGIVAGMMGSNFTHLSEAVALGCRMCGVTSDIGYMKEAMTKRLGEINKVSSDNLPVESNGKKRKADA